MRWRKFDREVYRLGVGRNPRVGYVMLRGGQWEAFTWFRPRVHLGLFDSLAVAQKAVEEAWLNGTPQT